MPRLPVAIWFLLVFLLFVRLLNAALFGMSLPETGARFLSGGLRITTL
jgi:hypothetical protein